MAESERCAGPRPIWVVLPDPLSARIFFDCGIVRRLAAALGDRLEILLLLSPDEAAEWAAREPGVRVSQLADVYPAQAPVSETIVRRLDRWLDRQAGFYPLAIRHSLRHGFHRDRMQPGHRNWFLDPTRAGPLPRWDWVERAMLAWHYSGLRYVPSTLRRRLAAERPAILLSNVQMQVVVPLIVAARRLRLPIVGYLASWDHTVGKGVVSPHLACYLVQNEVMRGDLERYHSIDAGRVVVTGWPQTDVFSEQRSRADYEALLAGFGLRSDRPVVLVAGNTPTNAPYEGRFVERLVAWWQESGARERFSLLLRPHPRDRRWRERFAAALDCDGAYVQASSYTDIETLACLLQHVDCVVSNAGTILLDSLVNDRPAVCVLYDEGAPPGERWAAKNVTGEHYRELVASAAFYPASRFEDVVAAVERALARPDELARERARVARDVVGVVDGRAAERVVEATLAVVSCGQLGHGRSERNTGAETLVSGR